MPVPKRKRSKSRRDKRFANKGLEVKTFMSCAQCSAPTLPHQVCATCGFYKGVKIMAYYFPHWGNFNTDILPLDKLTHIIFSFTEVIGNEMKFENDSSGIMLKKLVAEKKKHHNLKVMIACG